MVLCNTLTGHRCAIPRAGASLVKQYLSNLAVIEEPLDEVGQYLVAAGYLVPQDLDEGACFDMAFGFQQYRTDFRYMILVITNDCNFSCVYCAQKPRSGSMESWVQSAIRQHVAEQTRWWRALQIAWFGGEPLLAFDVIENLAPYFRDVTKKSGTKLSSHITTNGYLLTPDRSRKLLQWGVTDYQITLDGVGEIHDQMRPLKDGGGTFSRIMDNLSTMAEYDDDFAVRLRVNFDQHSVHELSRLFALLKERLKGDERFRLAFHPVGRWGGPNDLNIDIVDDEKAAYAYKQALRDDCRKAGLRYDLSTMFAQGPSICYAARPYSCVIGTDGTIMKCSNVLERRDENVVGRLLPDGRMTLDATKYLKWVGAAYRTPTCMPCFFLPVCNGGFCPLNRIATGSPQCPETKTWIQKALIESWEERRAAGIGTRLSLKRRVPGPRGEDLSKRKEAPQDMRTEVPPAV
jgi:uncharacterized protein